MTVYIPQVLRRSDDVDGAAIPLGDLERDKALRNLDVKALQQVSLVFCTGLGDADGVAIALGGLQHKQPWHRRKHAACPWLDFVLQA